MQNIGLSGYLQSEKYRFFTAGRIQRNLCFVGRGFQRGRRPLWQRKSGMSITVFILFFSEGKHPMKPGGFVAGVSKGGWASLGTRSCLQGLVCYTFCGRGRRRGLATGQRKGRSATQDRRGLQGICPKTKELLRSKARLADRSCVRLDGAKRKKSVCSRAADGI